MRINRLLLIPIFALLATTSSAIAALAQFAPTEQIVTSRIVASVDKLLPGTEFELAVIAEVKQDYNVGAHDSNLYPAKLTVTAPEGVTLSEPIYPGGELKEFPFSPGEKISVYKGEIVIRLQGQVAGNAKPGRVTFATALDTQACKGDQCFPPQLSESTLEIAIASPGEAVNPANEYVFQPVEVATAAGSAEADGENSGGLQGLIQLIERSSPLVSFPLLYLIGLILAFTPCIYPMIPVTIGYFSSQSEASRSQVLRLAAFYVLGIAITYSVLGVVAAVTGGVFGAAMQQPLVIAAVALILITLALSMFGLFEIRPPAFLASRASGKSGPLGALVMGLIFGIVAAPCAGPAVISLMLIVANLGKPTLGFLMFFMLALGLGTPLFFLAAFSAKMPMPGMWMVTVKKIAGFLLLGTAVFFALPVLPKSIAPYAIPAVILAGGIYLGFFDKALSGMRFGNYAGKAGCLAALAVAASMVMSVSPRESIVWEPYTPQALAQAAAEGKPVMVDFTADWCAYCEKLEKGPFSDPNVIKAAERFTRLKLDATASTPASDAAMKAHNIRGLPTILFFDSSGKEVSSARVEGYAGSAELMERMEKAK